MPKQIPLTKGYFAIVDDEDFETLSQHRWGLGGHGEFRYARGYLNGLDGKRAKKGQPKRISQRMHRVIMGLPPGRDLIVDHINGNGLDNRRCNLRVTDFKGNNQNRKPLSNKISRFKGVGFIRRDNRWSASIRLEGKTRRLGSFACETLAAITYDRAAKKEFGEFAYLNFSRREPTESLNMGRQRP